MPALSVRHVAASTEILFIGSRCNFSPSLIAVTGQELGQIAMGAVSSLAGLRDEIEDTGEAPTLLILDEPTARGLSDEDITFLLGQGNMSLAIAFSTEEFGRECYEDARLRCRPISIFPLNLRLDVWLSVVKLVVHGGNYLFADIIPTATAPPAAIALPDADAVGLTPRQHDVLQLVADGRSNKCIAAALGLSVHTVKLHLRNANQRLGAHNRTEAAMRYRALQA